jgi:hypothetical protein
MYKVIKHFTDLKDGKRPYNVGDVFPREGLDVSEARLSELAGKKNRQKTPLIVKEKRETPKEETKNKPAVTVKVKDTHK